MNWQLKCIFLEIMCAGLPEISKFGHYDPTDCTNQKVAHGSNCTLICDEGFEVKGPTVKTCGGKKSGVWSNRSKLPKCVGKPFHRKNQVQSQTNFLSVQQ